MLSLLRLLLAAVLFSQSPLSMADGDHDRARKALEQGKIMPLQQILQKISAEYPGQVLEVELEQEKNTWIYEIKQLSKNGTISKLEVNASTGVVIRQKSKKMTH